VGNSGRDSLNEWMSKIGLEVEWEVDGRSQRGGGWGWEMAGGEGRLEMMEMVSGILVNNGQNQ